ncbi:MAG TPA: hypothetical protein VH158_09000, partial [Gemmatimonadales bacterium]|nr:hypothetical protein [Gemmatimonadales bacterium]
MARKNDGRKAVAGRKGAGAKPHVGRADVTRAAGAAKPKAGTKPAAKPTAKGAAPPAPAPPKVKFRGRVFENEPLARYTTYRIGGP